MYIFEFLPEMLEIIWEGSGQPGEGILLFSLIIAS